MNELMTFEHVTKRFRVSAGRETTAVSDFSLTIYEGETLGLVGESGSGKSTVARIAAGLYTPDEGVFCYRGQTFTPKGYQSRRAYASEVQMIFQDPFASLDPRMTVDLQIAENLAIQRRCAPSAQGARVLELLELVGLNKSSVGRYPHELSGGQLQRICIARALAGEPRFLICDEPVSALDVSVQSQIINLLGQLQRRMNMTYLFISHDLSLVRYLSSRIAVMHQGRIVELNQTQELFAHPQHTYTQTLLAAIPVFPSFGTEGKRGEIDCLRTVVADPDTAPLNRH